MLCSYLADMLYLREGILHSPVSVAQVEFCFGMLEWLQQVTSSSTVELMLI